MAGGPDAAADDTGRAVSTRRAAAPSSCVGHRVEYHTVAPSTRRGRDADANANKIVKDAARAHGLLVLLATFSTAANAVALSSSSLRSNCFMTSAAASWLSCPSSTKMALPSQVLASSKARSTRNAASRYVPRISDGIQT